MTNNTLKSTIEGIIASSALVVVTLDGTFNSKTGAPVLSPRTRPDQRNKFLKDFCEKVTGEESSDATGQLRFRIDTLSKDAINAIQKGHFSEAIDFARFAIEAQEQLDQPRVYYTIKSNVDLRTVAEKRAAKKEENAAKKATKQAEKEAAAAAKMANKVEPAQQTTSISEAPKSTTKGGKKAA